MYGAPDEPRCALMFSWRNGSRREACWLLSRDAMHERYDRRPYARDALLFRGLRIHDVSLLHDDGLLPFRDGQRRSSDAQRLCAQRPWKCPLEGCR